MTQRTLSTTLMVGAFIFAMIWGLGTLVTNPEYDDFDNLIRQSPTCWEDEVTVLVIWDPYGDLDLNNTVGCVPVDNLPVDGFRP